MNTTKLSFIAIYLCFSQAIFAQKQNQDKVVLRNTEVRVGRILTFDGGQIRLRSQDGSEVLIPASDIDTIVGTTYRTRFGSFSTGYYGYRYYSPFLARNTSANGMPLTFRYGCFLNGRWARYSQLTVIPQPDFTVTKLGYAYQYHFFRRHYNTFNLYAAVMPEVNFVEHNNTLFVTMSLRLGTSYFAGNKVRLFAELTRQSPQANINTQASFAFEIGVRYHREYLNYYHKLNAKIK